MIGSAANRQRRVLMVTVPVVGLTGPEPRVTPPLVIVTVPVVPTGKCCRYCDRAPEGAGPRGGDCHRRRRLVDCLGEIRVAVVLFESPL